MNFEWLKEIVYFLGAVVGLAFICYTVFLIKNDIDDYIFEREYKKWFAEHGPESFP